MICNFYVCQRRQGLHDLQFDVCQRRCNGYTICSLMFVRVGAKQRIHDLQFDVCQRRCKGYVIAD